jgi:site-specific recombinase XerD
MTEKYIEYVNLIQGNSPRTTANYNRYLKQFIRETGIKKIEEINTKTVNDFILSFKKNGYKNQTINYVLTAVRCWLKYEIKTNNAKVMSPKLIDNLKFSRPKMDIPATKIIEKINNLALSYRDKAIVHTFLSTGLRLSELSSIKIEDIDLENKISIRGKGGKLRLVFLSEKLKPILQDYIAGKKEGLLFPFSNQTIHRAIKSIGKKIGYNLHPHKLRHVFATNLLQNGCPIQHVQAILGHSSISTTQIYSHISNKSLQEEFKKYHSS